jgi:hypothetical protein
VGWHMPRHGLAKTYVEWHMPRHGLAKTLDHLGNFCVYIYMYIYIELLYLDIKKAYVKDINNVYIYML